MENQTDHLSGLCRTSRDERRVICRALMQWELKRPDSRLPLDGSIDIHDSPDLTPHYFLVRLQPAVAASTFVYCGAVLAGLCLDEPVHRGVAEVLPRDLRDRMLDFFHSAVRYRNALADSDSFLASAGQVLYRTIVMPLQNAEGAVSSIFGAFNYRIEPS